MALVLTNISSFVFLYENLNVVTLKTKLKGGKVLYW